MATLAVRARLQWLGSKGCRVFAHQVLLVGEHQNRAVPHERVLNDGLHQATTLLRPPWPLCMVAARFTLCLASGVCSYAGCLLCLP